MRARLTLLLFVFSIAMSVALLVLWVRSRHATDVLLFTHGRYLYELTSDRGRLAVTTVWPWPQKVHPTMTINPGPGRIAYPFWDTATGNTPWSLMQPWIGLGIRGGSGTVGFLSSNGVAVQVPAGTRWTYTGTVAARFRYVSAPHGLPFSVALLTALWSIAKLRKNRLRLRRGLCAVCGYDLRASSGRCPECGTEIGSTSLN